MTEDFSSPSYERRQALKAAAATSSRLVKASRPLKEYVVMAKRLREAFCRSVDERQVDAAYVYGLRLANLVLEALPRHPQWKQGQISTKDKQRLTDQVDQTLAQMEALKNRMDAEELLRQQQQRLHEESIRKEKEKNHREQQERDQRRQAAQQRLEEERQRILEAHRKELAIQQKQKEKNKIEESAMAKLQALQAKMNSSKNVAREDESKGDQELETTKVSASMTPSQSKSNKHQSEEQKTPTASTTSSVEAKIDPQVIESEDHREVTHPASPKLDRKLTPQSSREQKTIDLLQRAIQTEEERMNKIELNQIPLLLKTAKDHLRRFRAENDDGDKGIPDMKSNPHRRAALQCLARKKKLERQLEVSKGAIFQMETQIFMLENAMEDRQVQKTLEEASYAMANLKQDLATDATLDTFAEDLATSLSNGNVMLDEQEDEELLEELEEWVSIPDGSSVPVDLSEEESGILALPPTLSPIGLPDVPNEDSIENSAENVAATDSVRDLLKAVLG